MRVEGPPVDPGLQQERTALAWRRTGLALVVGALTIGRFSIEAFGSLVLVPMLAVVAAAVWVVVAALRRRPSDHAPEGFRHVLRDGRLPATAAGVTFVLCLVEAVTAATGHATPAFVLELAR